ncbi:membrane protein insertion efficiency factor YidD [Aquicoccus sp. SU-CL01552]|uniref:membrane protein insertion efficiency factor YidD n=1 Tax=Aquicoccus sp. SU-CL01552 TaxID=3127656 RepID=UPI003341868F
MPICVPQSTRPAAPEVRRDLIAGFTTWLLTLPVRGYRPLPWPWSGHASHFQPACSAYAIEVPEIHGPLRGPW